MNWITCGAQELEAARVRSFGGVGAMKKDERLRAVRLCVCVRVCIRVSVCSAAGFWECLSARPASPDTALREMLCARGDSGQVADNALKLGDLRRYCESMIELGRCGVCVCGGGRGGIDARGRARGRRRWDHALAIAPGVSMEYWTEVMVRVRGARRAPPLVTAAAQARHGEELAKAADCSEAVRAAGGRGHTHTRTHELTLRARAQLPYFTATRAMGRVRELYESRGQLEDAIAIAVVRRPPARGGAPA